MAEPWYVQLEDGTVAGPFLEREVSDDLLSGKITSRQRVRQGATGAWCNADRAKTVFRLLTEQGWYIRNGNEEFGPFTDTKLLELHRNHEIEADSEVRQGLVGIWKSADAVLSIWQNQKAPVTTPAVQEDNRAWSIEPIRHLVMTVDVGTDEVPVCFPQERLLLESLAGAEPRISVSRTNGQRIGLLSRHNSALILGNADRGLSHVAMLHSPPASRPVMVAVVLCPAGATAKACRSYINEQFKRRAYAEGLTRNSRK